MGHFHCPSCGRELTYLTQYGRYYCYPEQKYGPKDLQPVTMEPIKEEPVLEVLASEPALGPTSEPSFMRIEKAPIPATPTAPEPVVEASVPITSDPAPLAADLPPQTPTVADAPKEETSPESPPSSELSPQPDEQLEPQRDEVAPVPEVDEARPKRPPLKRNKIARAKKGQLEKWCKAYDLDTTGTRNVLRDRLLRYMDERRLDEDEEITIVEAKMPGAIAEPAVEAAEPEPMAEPTPEEIVLAEPAPAPELSPEPIRVEPTPAPEAPPAKPGPIPELMPEPEPEPTPEPPTPRAMPPVSDVPAPAPPQAPVEEEILDTWPPEPAPYVRVEPAPTPTKVPEPPAPPEEPPIARVEVAQALPCPTCGKELTYVAKYDRLYCYSCGRYAPRDHGKVGVAAEGTRPPLPALVIEPPKVEPPRPVVRADNECPTCGRTMRYVREYDRWYCDAERKYAPRRSKNPCPTCGRELRYIGEYGRWHCDAEKRYAPKTYVAAAVPATMQVARPVLAPETRVEAVPAVSEQRVAVLEEAKHGHGGPGAGIALTVVGLVLLLLSPLLLFWFPLMGFNPLGFDPAAVDVNLVIALNLMNLLGLVALGAGIVAGLRAVRRR